MGLVAYRCAPRAWSPVGNGGGADNGTSRAEENVVIRRLLAVLIVCWLVGLSWFALALPGPSQAAQTDAIVVLTGGPGRFKRALQVLAAGRAKRLLVSGVDPVVRRSEFEAVQGVPPHLSHCCIDLGKDATDTVTNAQEAVQWIEKYKFRSVRLITTNWHMRRAQFELERSLPQGVQLVIDAVESEPSMTTLVVEYNKYISRRFAALLGY
jgi:uncharacterized SAM-binding protein YcdF (DUF218 family)